MTTLDELRGRLEGVTSGAELDPAYDLECLCDALGVEYPDGNPFVSLDAAIALVEAKLPGHRRWLHMWKDWVGASQYEYTVITDAFSVLGSDHKSEPIALLLALLSALEKESAE